MQLLIPILAIFTLFLDTANSLPLVSTTTLIIIQTNIQTITIHPTVQPVSTPASTPTISSSRATITSALLVKKHSVLNGLGKRGNYGEGGTDDTIQRRSHNGKERRGNNYGKHNTNNLYRPAQTQS